MARALVPRHPLDGRSVWVAGHGGMIGQALVRRLASEGAHVLTVAKGDLDLTRQQQVEEWVRESRPEVVFLLAAKSRGDKALGCRFAELLRDNLAIYANVIDSAWRAGAKRLVFVGSAASYPAHVQVPTPEDAILSGPLDADSQWYGLAKIGGIKLCEAYRREHGCDFVSAIPSSVFGPGDRFAGNGVGFVAALIKRTHDALRDKSAAVDVWGTGRPTRDLIFVDDCADALVLVAKHAEDPVTNVGSGIEVSIAHVARAVFEIAGYEGGMNFLVDRGDGVMRNCLDVSRLAALGWSARTSLSDGLRRTYRWFLENVDAADDGPLTLRSRS